MRFQVITKSVQAILFCLFAVHLQAQTTQDGLKVAVTTKTYGQCYDPKNASVMWITNEAGKFVKTIGIWSKSYRKHLNEWAKQSVGTENNNGDDNGIVSKGKNWDGTTAASRNNHGLITGFWDLKDKAGLAVPPGKYRYNIEMTECNNSGPYAYGDIVIGPSSVSRTGVDGGNTLCRECVSNAVVTYTSSGPDKTPPSIFKVNAPTRKSVVITFSETVEKTTATTLANFKLTYKNEVGDLNTVFPLNIASANLDATGKEVTLVTDSLFSQELYTLEIKNIKDVSESSNIAALLKADFHYQKIVTTDLTENLKMVFHTSSTPVGSVKSSFVTIYDKPANIRWASVLAYIDDLDDTLEASIGINQSPFYFNSGDGVASGSIAWGEIDVDTKYLLEGNNEVKVKFNSTLNGRTSGFSVDALKFQYEVYSLRKGGGITPVGPFEGRQPQNIHITNSQVTFGLTSKANLQGVIYDLQGNKVKVLRKGETSWNLLNESGVRSKGGVYMAVFKEGKLSQNFSFTLLK